MSVGTRLREERQRLGASQASFASTAGVAKNTQINWEKDASSPTANALVAWSEAGADALYILTGRRTADRPDNAASQIADDLASIRRNMLEPLRHIEPGEDRAAREQSVLAGSANRLKAMLDFDRPFLSQEALEEVESLLAIVGNPTQLAAFRAADYVQLRTKRTAMKEEIWSWLDGGGYCPSEAVANILATVAIDYAVPVKLVVEMVEELRDDIKRDKSGGMEPNR